MDVCGTVPLINDSWRSYATICRLCLQKDGFMLGIFNNIQGKEKSISKKIVDCTALSVSLFFFVVRSTIVLYFLYCDSVSVSYFLSINSLRSERNPF